MGLYDSVWVPCPHCGTRYLAQSKGGDCLLETFEVWEAPPAVLQDIDRHAPHRCTACGAQFAYGR